MIFVAVKEEGDREREKKVKAWFIILIPIPHEQEEYDYAHVVASYDNRSTHTYKANKTQCK